MKKLLTLSLILLLFSCKNDKKEEVTDATDTSATEEIQQKQPEYPQALSAIFKAHGGLDQWNKMNNICYEMDGSGGMETHTVSLKNRKTIIENKAWSIGYDGNDVWLFENEKSSYKGNARFYHNLMFYFYAMPFVLGDDGINYEDVGTTELKGKTYNGIKISYDAGVGDSSKDEYVLYFDPETHLMEWLGYTVTYMDDKKTDDWHYIKYDRWQDVNGLQLPEKMTFYNVKDGKPADEKKDYVFKKVTATETMIDDSVFKKPEGATVVEK